jgi:hypothetical protein
MLFRWVHKPKKYRNNFSYFIHLFREENAAREIVGKGGERERDKAIGD